ncbi:hypothetical protein P280DRAFT_520409 [Massarina eburnea CBS 473.64]|uniref:Uncharacterized protein n=1 Tax=Massarina eburnea CBS 473.64 TaxID=1395130 RepID=A0A6A6RRX8_9PLEO|nr:hypothetical protein P280DRAFT_520409 [Massarina eburnea CBS 473.64]
MSAQTPVPGSSDALADETLSSVGRENSSRDSSPEDRISSRYTSPQDGTSSRYSSSQDGISSRNSSPEDGTSSRNATPGSETTGSGPTNHEAATNSDNSPDPAAHTAILRQVLEYHHVHMAMVSVVHERLSLIL